MSRPKIVCIIGTRPEVIKMAPVIRRLRENPAFEPVTLLSGQHRELVRRYLDWFDLTVDADLDIMVPGQSLGALTARLIAKIGEFLESASPSAVLAQGDTTSVLAASLCCFYQKIPFGHVEAGLRTHDMHNPFPEELNRVVASLSAKWHFAPTESARDNLLREGRDPESIVVTGNTVVDALHFTAEKLGEPPPRSPGSKAILMTAHRRDNFGEPMVRIFRSVLDLCEIYPELEVVYPVHPNPNVRGLAHDLLGKNPQIRLTEPLEYGELVQQMRRCDLILTDSGGIQEEAPVFGKPVLLMREATERPEAVQAGVAEIVGTDRERIVSAARRLFEDRHAYEKMANATSPYGDGHSAERIEHVLLDDLVGKAAAIAS